MGAKTIIFWTATTLIGLEQLAGGYVDLTHGLTNVFNGTPVVDVVTQLGYPVYVLTILGVLKIPGAITLFVPGVPRLKEWVYAGLRRAVDPIASSTTPRVHRAVYDLGRVAGRAEFFQRIRGTIAATVPLGRVGPKPQARTRGHPQASPLRPSPPRRSAGAGPIG